MADPKQVVAGWTAEVGAYGTWIRDGRGAQVALVYSPDAVPLVLNSPLLFHALGMVATFLGALKADAKFLEDDANQGLLLDAYAFATQALTYVDENWSAVADVE